MWRFSWVLVVVPFLTCCGGKGERNAAESEESEEVEEPEETGEQKAVVSDCMLQRSDSECMLSCLLEWGDSVIGHCEPATVPGAAWPWNCSCQGGPSDGKLFSVSSCDDLQASVESMCTATSPPPACPTVVPMSGQACSHEQNCWIEEVVSECSEGDTVRSRSVGFDCIDGVWQETGVGEDFCP